MRTIFKTQLKVCDQQTVQLPRGFKILDIDRQGGMPCIWYECDSEAEKVDVDIYCVGTGQNIDGISSMMYIGTVHDRSGGFVWHYYLKPTTDML